VTSLALHPDGRRRIWELDRDAWLDALPDAEPIEEPRDGVVTVLAPPDGLLVTVHRNRNVRLWRGATAECLRTVEASIRPSQARGGSPAHFSPVQAAR
jgi:hypothetical protein